MEAGSFWHELRRKDEALGTHLDDYVRIMFENEANFMLKTGCSYSNEWFEVWDGRAPPIVYSLCGNAKIEDGRYKRVLFFDINTAEKNGICLHTKHPAYSRLMPGIFLLGVKLKRGIKELDAIRDITALINQRKLMKISSELLTIQDFEELALEPIFP